MSSRTAIANDDELQVTRERIIDFQQLLANLRRAARPDEFEAVASGYRLEIERMHAEVMAYYLRPLDTPRETVGALAH